MAARKIVLGEEGKTFPAAGIFRDETGLTETGYGVLKGENLMTFTFEYFYDIRYRIIAAIVKSELIKKL